MLATNLTPSQEAFVKMIESKVGKMLGSQLPGTFQMASYPPGFHPAVQFSNPPVYNASMLDAFNGMLTVGSNGMLTLGNSQFNTTYNKILAAASYQYSDADNKIVQDPNIENQQIAVTNTATSSGFVAAYSLKAPVTYFSVVKAVLDNFGNGKTDFTAANISAATKGLSLAGFSGLGQAITSAMNQLAPLLAIQNAQAQAEAELAAAQQNTQYPTADNGGLNIGNGEFYVGYGPLPENNQVQGILQGGSSVSVNIQASNFESQDIKLSIDGNVGFTVPILDVLDIGLKAGASYDWSKSTSSSSSLNVTMEYKGVGMVQIDPEPLSADNAKGWYDETLLQSIVTGSGDSSVSGFKIPTSSQFNIPNTFGEGKTFSRFRTLVISQAPTITMTFSADQAKSVESEFKQNASVKVKLFGIFDVGSFDESYSIKNVHKDSASGSVTVTLAPPEIVGSVPLEKQVCNILGGVAQYPPNN